MENNIVNAPYSFIVPSHLPGHGGWGNGYVAIPKGHPLYGMGYDAIHDDYEIDIHGGLTYSNTWSKEHGDNWVIGFDTLHSGDEINPMSKEDVQAEADNLLSQVNNLTYSEGWKRKQFEIEAVNNYTTLKEESEKDKALIRRLQDENKARMKIAINLEEKKERAVNEVKRLRAVVNRLQNQKNP